MEKRIINKIKDLQGSVANQEEFMKQLAGIDENGQLTEDVQVAVNGGDTVKTTLIDLPMLGMWVPTFPDVLG